MASTLVIANYAQHRLIFDLRAREANYINRLAALRGVDFFIISRIISKKI